MTMALEEKERELLQVIKDTTQFTHSGGSVTDLIKYYQSERYRNSLAADLFKIPADPHRENDYLSAHRQPILSFPIAVIECWQKILESVLTVAPERYSSIHKGTPFYFLAMASYRIGDFEGALFYMDSAVGEDYRVHSQGWANCPAGLFLKMDTSITNQAAMEENRHTLDAFERAGSVVDRIHGFAMNVSDFRAKLVRPAVEEHTELRSVLTAILSFVLELPARERMLRLAPSSGGTSEPFFLHLLKGALIFETLLAQSNSGKNATARAKQKLTIGDYLREADIYGKLGFGKPPQGFGNIPFEDVIARANDMKNQSSPPAQRCVCITWAVRNTLGHSLGWGTRLTSVEYEDLFACVYGAISLSILRLF